MSTAPSILTARARDFLIRPERLAALADYDLLGPHPLADDPGTIGHLRDLTRLAVEVCGVTSAAVNILDGTHQHQVAASGIAAAACTIDESMCAVSLVDGGHVDVPDAATDDRFRTNPFVDGRLGRVRMYASTPLTTAGGDVVGSLCVFDRAPGVLVPGQREGLRLLGGQVAEVLELRRRTRQLDAALDELHRSNDRLGDFASRISHDLKTPLTAIVGFAELLQRHELNGEDPVTTRFADNIVSSGQRMRAMIDDLLAYASVGGQPRLEQVDVEELVGQVLADLGPHRQLPVQVVARVPVVADPLQLRSLLQNLLYNAHLQAPGSPVEVRADAETGGGWQLRVVDHGPGVPAHERERVLNPLVRLRGRDEVPGTGLGLSTCAQVAATHGGTIRLDETPGGGLTVTVRVP